MRWLLRKLGYRQVTWGYATGRAWLEVDGVLIAQSGEAMIYAADDQVKYAISALQRPAPPPPTAGEKP